VVIGLPIVFVAVEIGTTVPERWSTTYRVFPSGVSAIMSVKVPTLIAGPVRLVRAAIGMTRPLRPGPFGLTAPARA
jgi:hypothetical protein